MEHNKKLWTLLVPAAGAGTRLEYSGPKLLYPVLKRPILDHILQPMQQYCATASIVVSPAAHEEVLWKISSSLYDIDTRIGIQKKPTGMLDAIEIGMRYVKTQNVLIAWGDLVGLDRIPWKKLFAAFYYSVVPVVEKKNPYTAIVRGSRTVEVLQSREGDAMPEVGESDVGVFLFQSALLRMLVREVPEVVSRGKVTGERNFLPVLSYWCCTEKQLFATPVLKETEVPFGINTREDAEAYIKTCRLG